MSGTNGHTHGAGVDLGADRATRPQACTKRTWCILLTDHEGSCVEIPRGKPDATDFGPKR